MTEKIRKVSRAYNELSAELGRDPAQEEVAVRLGWETGEVRTAQGAAADAVSLNKTIDSSRALPSSETSWRTHGPRTRRTP